MVLKQCVFFYENIPNSAEKIEFCNDSRQENCEDEIEFLFLPRTP